MAEFVGQVIGNVFVSLGAIFLLTLALPHLAPRSPLLRQAVLGLLFGGVVALSMKFAFPIGPGIFADLRNAIIAVAAITSGPIAALIATAFAIVCRLEMGGQVIGAIVSLCLCSGLSIAMAPRLTTSLRLAGYGAVLAIVNTAIPSLGLLIAAPPPGLDILAVVERVLGASATLYPLWLVLVVRLVRRELVRIDKEQRLQEQNQALSKTEQRFSDVFDLSCVPMAWVDLTTRRFLKVNREYEQFSGYGRDELLDMTVDDLSLDGMREDDVSTLVALRNGTRMSANGERRYRTKSGATKWGNRTVTATAGESGEVLGFAIIQDITEQKLASERATYLAQHDPLTGLYNRSSFGAKLGSEPQDAGQTAVLLLDVDDFKKVNDTYGHAAGDDVLKYVAGVVSENSEATDVVARLGGDEFALMRKGCSADEAMQWAQKIAEAIGSPQARDRVVSDVRVSIGIALASDGSADTDQLMKNADLALYASKKRGKSYVSLYDETMEDALVAQEMMRSDLAVAVSNLAFSLQYQPLIDIATGEVTAFEALLRWQRRPGEMVSPAVFVPMLEESRDIIAVGEWVLRQACELAASLPTSISIAVNISARQFEPTLPLRVASALSRAGLPASRLQLEITESVLIAADDANLDILQQLRGLGVRVALDDFGTGYSSLGYLHRFQFDKLKIDQSFVGQERNREQAHTIIRSIAQLGHSLGIRVTAEGIETPADLKEVQDAGCHEAQGYLFSRPIPADRIWSFIEERSGEGPGARLPQLTSAARAP